MVFDERPFSDTDFLGKLQAIFLRPAVASPIADFLVGGKHNVSGKRYFSRTALREQFRRRV